MLPSTVLIRQNTWMVDCGSRTAVGVPLNHPLWFSINFRSANFCEHDIQYLLSKQQTKSKENVKIIMLKTSR